MAVLFRGKFVVARRRETCTKGVEAAKKERRQYYWEGGVTMKIAVYWCGARRNGGVPGGTPTGIAMPMIPAHLPDHRPSPSFAFDNCGVRQSLVR